MPTVMQWTNHLLSKVEEQKQYAKPWECRYRNDYVLPLLIREYREVYGAEVEQVLPSLNPPRTGTAAIPVDALTQRLTVQGAISDDKAAVTLVQQAWEDNDLDVMHREAHREALIKGRSFAQVARSDRGKAVVGIESPEQVAVHRQQGAPYDIDAALKVWADEWTGKRFGRLALPGRDLDLFEDDVAHTDPEGSLVQSRWVVQPGGDRPAPASGVPFVEFANRARLLADPVSEIEPIWTECDIADLIDGLMVFAGHFGAVPIHWATGLSVPRDPKDPSKPLLGPDGKPIIGFKPRSDHLWVNSDAAGKFGQLTPATLDTFVTWAKHVSARIQAATQLASTYFSVDLRSHMTAELLKTDEAPMVRRILEMGRDGSFGQSWRRVDQLILEIEGPAAGIPADTRVKPRWADPETRVESLATDSFQKQVASGLGVRAAAEKTLGWDPDLVERAVAEAEAAKDRAAERAAENDPAMAAATKLLSAGPDAA